MQTLLDAISLWKECWSQRQRTISSTQTRHIHTVDYVGQYSRQVQTDVACSIILYELKPQQQENVGRMNMLQLTHCQNIARWLLADGT